MIRPFTIHIWLTALLTENRVIIIIIIIIIINWTAVVATSIPSAAFCDAHDTEGYQTALFQLLFFI